jgi:hypothetical protein
MPITRTAFFMKFLDFNAPPVNHGRAPLRVKELARLRVARLNGCHESSTRADQRASSGR